MSGASALDVSVPCADCGHSETKSDFAHDGTAHALGVGDEPASTLSCSLSSGTLPDAIDIFANGTLRPSLTEVPNTNEAQTSAYVATPPAAPVIYGGNTAAMANNYPGSVFTQGSAYGSKLCTPDAAGKDAFLKFTTPGSRGVSADVEVEISSLDVSFDQTIALWDATPITVPSAALMSNDTRHAAFLASIGPIDDGWVVKRTIMSSLLPGALRASTPRLLPNDDVQDLGDPLGKHISVAGATSAAGMLADFPVAMLGCGTSDTAADMIYKVRPSANTTIRAAVRDPSASSFVPAVAIIRGVSGPPQRMADATPASETTSSGFDETPNKLDAQAVACLPPNDTTSGPIEHTPSATAADDVATTSLGCSTGGFVDAALTANTDYYIIVKGASAGQTGTYNLTVTDIGAVQDFGCETDLSAPDAYFDFSVRADARDVTISLNEWFGKLDGSFQLMRDVPPLDDSTNDVAVGPCQTRAFTYTNLSAGRYYVVLRGSAAANGAGRLPAEITIRDESGVNALDCADVSVGGNGKLTRKLAAGTMYYVGITSRNGAAGGSYRLQIRDTSVPLSAPVVMAAGAEAAGSEELRLAAASFDSSDDSRDPVIAPPKIVCDLSGAGDAVCPNEPAVSEDVISSCCETTRAAVGYGYAVYDPQPIGLGATLLNREHGQPYSDVYGVQSDAPGPQAPTVYQWDTTY